MPELAIPSRQTVVDKPESKINRCVKVRPFCIARIYLLLTYMSAHDSNFFLKTRVFADGKGESRLEAIGRDNFQTGNLI